MKKNILKKIILLTAMFCGCVNATMSQEYGQPISMEGVDMYGFITFSPINEIDDMIPGLYKFGIENNYRPDDNSVLFNRYISGGGVYHNGKFIAIFIVMRQIFQNKNLYGQYLMEILMMCYMKKN